MPMRTDKFMCNNEIAEKIKQNPSNSMTPLADFIIYLTIADDNKSKVRFYEDYSKMEISSIEVNGVQLWNISRLLELPLDEKLAKILKTEMKKALTEFITLSNELHQKIAFKLHKEFLFTMLEFLRQNYQFDGKSYLYAFGFPPATDTRNFDFIRIQENENIHLKISFSSYAYRLIKNGELFGLKHINDPHDSSQYYRLLPSSSETDAIPICHVNLELIVIFPKSNAIPKVEYKLQVDSDCPWFKYQGDCNIDGILKLENVDNRNVIPTSSSIYPKDNLDLVFSTKNAVLYAIKSHSVAIGSLVANIIRYNDDRINIFCEDLMNLFNTIMKVMLLTQQLLLNLKCQPLPEGLEELSCNLFSLIKLAEQNLATDGTHNNGLLFDLVYRELIDILNKMPNKNIVLLLTIFQKEQIIQIKNSAKFINQKIAKLLKCHSRDNVDPEIDELRQKISNYLSENKEYACIFDYYNYHCIFKLTYIISIATEMITSALKFIQQDKGFVIVSDDQPGPIMPINDFNDLYPKFNLYLINLCSRQSRGDEPLNDQILNEIEYEKLPSIEAMQFNANLNETVSQVHHFEDSVILLQHIHLPESEIKLRCCPYPSEKTAALIKYNPATKGFIYGFSIYFNLFQITKLYPNFRQPILPYLSVINILSGTAGIWMSGKMILHPQRYHDNTIFRISEAIIDGLTVYVFNLGTAINIYMTLTPEANHSNESNLVFWGKIAPLPLFFTMCYIVWNSISHQTKQDYFSSNKCLIYTNRILDYFTKFLLCTGIANTFIMQALGGNGIKVPIASAITGVGFSLGYLPPISERIKERVDVFRVYITCINFLILFIQNVISNKELSSDQLIKRLTYAQIGFWTLATLGSIYFTIKNSLAFVTEYKSNPTIVTQELPENSPEISPSNRYRNFLPMASYQELTRAKGDRNKIMAELSKLLPERNIEGDHNKEYSTTSLQPPTDVRSATKKNNRCTIS